MLSFDLPIRSKADVSAALFGCTGNGDNTLVISADRLSEERHFEQVAPQSVKLIF